MLLLDPTVLHDEVLNIMIAGRDTVSTDIYMRDPFPSNLLQTAGTLTIVIYFLTQHPDVLKRLREEILSKVGPSRRPTYDDVREMKYLRAVINGKYLLVTSALSLTRTMQKRCGFSQWCRSLFELVVKYTNLVILSSPWNIR